MINSRTANICVKVMFAGSIFLAMEGTFVSFDFVRSGVNISAAFCFYFLIRNPELLVAKNFDEFGDLLDDAVDKKFIWGTTPLYPAILLVSIGYIAYMRFGLPF